FALLSCTCGQSWHEGRSENTANGCSRFGRPRRLKPGSFLGVLTARLEAAPFQDPLLFAARVEFGVGLCRCLKEAFMAQNAPVEMVRKASTVSVIWGILLIVFGMVAI